jgi:hypothetical protein
MPVLFVYHFNHPINGQALLKSAADKVFFFFGTARHVTGAVNQEKLTAPAAGTSKIRGHQFDLALNGCIAARIALKTGDIDACAGDRSKNHFDDKARRKKEKYGGHDHPV